MRTIQIAILFALCASCESAEEIRAEMERAVFLDARLAEQDAWMAQDVVGAKHLFEANMLDPATKEAAKKVEPIFRMLDSLCNDVGIVIVAVCEELIHQVDGLDTVRGVKTPAKDWRLPQLPETEEVLGSVGLEQVMKSNPVLKQKWDSLGNFHDSLLHLLCDRRDGGEEWSYAPMEGFPFSRCIEHVHVNDRDLAESIHSLLEPFPALNGSGQWSLLHSGGSLVEQVSLLRSMAITVRKAQWMVLGHVRLRTEYCVWRLTGEARVVVYPQNAVLTRGEKVTREVGFSFWGRYEGHEIRYVIDNPSLDTALWERSEKGEIILDARESGVHKVYGYLIIRTARGEKKEPFEYSYVVQ